MTMRENIMRFGWDAGTWASKTDLALTPINDCGTKVGNVALLNHELYNGGLLILEIIYLVGQDWSASISNRNTMNENPRGVYTC